MTGKVLYLFFAFLCHVHWCNAVIEPCVTVVALSTEPDRYSAGCCCTGINQPCDSLELGLSCVQTRNNSVLLIKGGLYILNGSVSVRNSANFSVIGESTINNSSEIVDVMIKCSVTGGGLWFVNAFNVTILGLKFKKCGSKSTTYNAGALHFVNSSIITLINLNLISSDSYGVVLSDLCGFIDVTGLIIANNTAGGIKVTFHQECHRFMIFNSVYVAGNGLPNPNSQGGGMYIEITASNVQVSINNSIFLSNVAHFGGSLYILINGNATGNGITISSSKFISNQFHKPENNDEYRGSRGGGARIVYDTMCGGNWITFDECSFEFNIAAIGAALSVVSKHVTFFNELGYNQVNISNAKILLNTALLGSAIHAEAYSNSEDGFTAVLLISSCKIISNDLSFTKHQALGTGVVYTNRIKLFFYESNHLKSNYGSALCISSTAVHFSDDSVTVFENNTGFNGGAIAVTNLGKMIMHNRASLSFINNSAINKGGAIAVLGYGELNLDTNHYESCFLKCSSTCNVNAKLFFSYNRASGAGNSIFIPSLQQCYDGGTSIVCSGEWHYVNSNCLSEVATLAAHIIDVQNKTGVKVYPGYQTKLPIVCLDDNMTNITSLTPLFAEVSDNSMLLDANSIYVSDGYCTLYRNEESTHGYLNLYTLSSRLLIVTLEIMFMDCPPGYREVRLQGNSTFFKCSCNDFFATKCDLSKLKASLYDTYCVSLRESFKFHLSPVNNGSKYLFAQCLFTSNRPIRNHYYELPKNLSSLENGTCNYWNRTGLFCSECQENTGIDVASWVYECIHCPSNNLYFLKNLLLLITGKLLPIVLFFLIIVLFHVNLTSGSINLYIWFCQVITLRDNLVAFQSHFNVNAHLHNRWLMLLFFPLAIWNLDFMEFFFSNVCISKKLKIIHIVTLDYVTALCPLLLIALSYTLIELHARGIRPIMIAWKPFRKCIRFFHKRNIRHSIIDVFAAFILLSYSKFTNITFLLLVPNQVYDNNGSVVGYVVFADASIKYGSSEHTFFLVLAIIVFLIVIILPPLLLLLYPLRCFNCIHSRLSTRKRLALMTFVEAFQGCYKDGTNGSKDCRFVGSLYFFIRVLSVVTTRFLASNVEIERVIQLLLLNLVIFTVAFFQPYKKSLYNRLDIVILFAISGVLAIAFFYAVPDSLNHDSVWLELIFAVFIFLPSLCFTTYCIYKVLLTVFNSTRIDQSQRPTVTFANERTPLVKPVHDGGSLRVGEDEESLPDRLIHPSLY